MVLVNCDGKAFEAVGYTEYFSRQKWKSEEERTRGGKRSEDGETRPSEDVPSCSLARRGKICQSEKRETGEESALEHPC